MPRVVLKGYILVSNADLGAVKQELPSHIDLTRKEPGCLAFEVQQDQLSLNRFNVYEEFSDEHSFELYQERVRHSKWRRISANIERHYQINICE